MLAADVSELQDLLADAWDVVPDLVFYEYGKCYNCQPYEGGEPVWLGRSQDLLDAAMEVIELVADVNEIGLPSTWEDLVAEAIDESAWTCAECGTELTSGDEVGENIFDEGTDPDRAQHLLTQAHWPFLTHYISGDSEAEVRERFESILRERVVRASSKFIMGGHKVVCLTECSPPEIRELLRVSQEPADFFDQWARWKQLGHEKMNWARSTWGLALNRTALVAAGARPAIHGTPALYHALPNKDAFRFVRFEHGSKFADWTFEREFRFPGDISLDGPVATSVFLVVPNRTERWRLLARVDVPPWPIMPFDFPLAPGEPVPRPTGRQREMLSRYLL